MPRYFVMGEWIDSASLREIARGGEGAVYATSDPNTVVKILFGNPQEPSFNVNMQKLKLMLEGGIKRWSSRMMWPTSGVLDENQYLVGYAMPFFRGRTLKSVIEERRVGRNGGFTNSQLTCAAQQWHRVLRAAHASGVVIADVAPANVMISDTGEIMVLEPETASFLGLPSLGVTPAYVDPEKCDLRQPVNVFPDKRGVRTPRSDLYSFSFILCELLTGIRPYPLPKAANQLQQRDNVSRMIRGGRSIFNGEKSPDKGYIPLSALPEDLCKFLESTICGKMVGDRFERNEKRDFPKELLSIHWEKCSACGKEFASRRCPCGRGQKKVVVTPAPKPVGQQVPQQPVQPAAVAARPVARAKQAAVPVAAASSSPAKQPATTNPGHAQGVCPQGATPANLHPLATKKGAAECCVTALRMLWSGISWAGMLLAQITSIPFKLFWYGIDCLADWFE